MQHTEESRAQELFLVLPDWSDKVYTQQQPSSAGIHFTFFFWFGFYFPKKMYRQHFWFSLFSITVRYGIKYKRRVFKKQIKFDMFFSGGSSTDMECIPFSFIIYS